MSSPVGALDTEASPVIAEIGLTDEGDAVFRVGFVHMGCFN